MPARAAHPVDTRVRVGSIELPHPVLLASGTAGYGDELARYLHLDTLGASFPFLWLPTRMSR